MSDGAIHLDHWAPSAGGRNGVAFLYAGLRSSPQRVQLFLEGAPIDQSGRSKFISHDVFHALSLFLLRRLWVLWAALSKGGFSSVGYLDPLRVRRDLALVVVVPVPPLVRRRLRVTFWRVLPSLLTAERRDIEVAPGGPHRLIAAAIDELGAEHPLV